MNLWEQVGNQCLTQALALLEDKESVPETIALTERLVRVAIAIDTLNLQWAQQNRSYAAVSRGQLSSQQAEEKNKGTKAAWNL